MSSCATASAFGWDFQCNAAIVFMIEYINSIKSIRVEGKTEDIEMVCDDGGKIYGQAKSIVKYDDYTNVLNHLRKGLKTLNEAAKRTDAKKLIYVTNTPNPFKKTKSMEVFRNRTTLLIKDLPKECIDVIDKYIDRYNYDALDKEKLEIDRIPFNGDGANRYKEVKEVILEFLCKLNLSSTGIANKVMGIWQKDFFHNASQEDTSITVSKKEFMWTIIVTASENTDKDFELKNFDISEYEVIEEKYREIIDSKSEMFTFLSRVIFDYENSKEFREKEDYKKYIENVWRRYLDEFEECGLEGWVIEGIIKIILNRILKRRLMIKNVRKEVNI